MKNNSNERSLQISVGKSIFSDTPADKKPASKSKSVIQVFRSNKHSLFGKFDSDNIQNSNLDSIFGEVRSCNTSTQNQFLIRSGPVEQSGNKPTPRRQSEQLRPPETAQAEPNLFKSDKANDRELLQSELAEVEPGDSPQKKAFLAKKDKTREDLTVQKTRDLLSQQGEALGLESQSNAFHLLNINKMIVNSVRSNAVRSDGQIISLLDDLKERFRKETLKKNIVLLANEDMLCELQRLRQRVSFLERENSHLKRQMGKSTCAPNSFARDRKHETCLNIVESFLTSKKSGSMRRLARPKRANGRKASQSRRGDSLKLECLVSLQKRVQSSTKGRHKNNFSSLTKCRSKKRGEMQPSVPSHSKSTVNRKRVSSSSKFFKSIKKVFKSRTNLLDSKIRFFNTKLQNRKKRQFFLFNSKNSRARSDKKKPLICRRVYSHLEAVRGFVLRKKQGTSELVSVAADGLRSFAFRPKSNVVFHSQMDQIISEYSKTHSLLDFATFSHKTKSKTKISIDAKNSLLGINPTKNTKKKRKRDFSFQLEHLSQKHLLKTQRPGAIATNSLQNLYIGSESGSLWVHFSRTSSNEPVSLQCLNISTEPEPESFDKFKAFKSAVSCLRVTEFADADLVYAADDTGTLKIFSVPRRQPREHCGKDVLKAHVQCVFRKKYKSPVGSLGVDSEHRLTYSFGFRQKNKIKISDLVSNKCISNLTLKGETPANCLAYGVNGLLWYVASSGASFCDLRMKNPIVKVYSDKRGTKGAGLFSFSCVGDKRVIFGGQKNSLHLFDLRKPKAVQRKFPLGESGSGHFVSDIAFDSDSSALFASSSDGNLYQVDYKSSFV